jgi:hypothetical protein
VTELLDLIGAKWPGIGVCLGVVGTACVVIIGSGWRFGMRGLQKWVVSIHQPEQIEAKQKIRRALDERADPDKRCEDLLSGWDAWRFALDQSQRAIAWLRRLQLPLYLLLLASGGAIAAKYFNDTVAEVMALLAGILVVWTAIAIAPLCMFIHRHGLPSKEGAPAAAPGAASGPAPPAPTG